MLRYNNSMKNITCIPPPPKKKKKKKQNKNKNKTRFLLVSEKMEGFFDLKYYYY